MLSTIEEIVDDLYKNLLPNKKLLLKKTPFEGLIELNCSFGKVIRIRYHLTSDNPIVRTWFDNPANRVIIGHLDASEDHPYNVSLKIIQEVWKKVNAENTMKVAGLYDHIGSSLKK
jgi:hypothetical protein